MCSDIRATIDDTEKQTRSLNAFHEDTKSYELGICLLSNL